MFIFMSPSASASIVGPIRSLNWHSMADVLFLQKLPGQLLHAEPADTRAGVTSAFISVALVCSCSQGFCILGWWKLEMKITRTPACCRVAGAGTGLQEMVRNCLEALSKPSRV